MKDFSGALVAAIRPHLRPDMDDPAIRTLVYAEDDALRVTVYRLTGKYPSDHLGSITIRRSSKDDVAPRAVVGVHLDFNRRNG